MGMPIYCADDHELLFTTGLKLMVLDKIAEPTWWDWYCGENGIQDPEAFINNLHELLAKRKALLMTTAEQEEALLKLHKKDRKAFRASIEGRSVRTFLAFLRQRQSERAKLAGYVRG